MTFLTQIGLMLLGALFVLWVRAAWSARAAGDEWDWRYFLFTNVARFILSAIGVLIVGTAAYVDAAGVQSTLEQFGTGIQLGAGFGTGAMIAAFLLILPASGKSAAGLLLLSSILVTTACPKANQTLRDVKEQSAKVKIYARNIQKANIEGFREGDVSTEQFAATTRAIKQFRDAVATLDKSVQTAETLIREGAEVKKTIDVVEFILDESVVREFDNLAAVITGFPVLNDKAKDWIAAIRLALTAIRTLIAGQNGGGLIYV